MRKGIAPVVAVALIGVVAILVVEGVFLTNFIVRMESVVRAIKEGEIILAINEMEFVKKALRQALPYSFYQASYYIAGRGGYSDFGSTPSYNCIPYWRSYATTNYPNNYKDVIAENLLKAFNDYGGSLEDPVSIPEYTKATIEEKQIKTGEKTCEGTATPCSNLGRDDCFSQQLCHWAGGGKEHIDECLGLATPCSSFTSETCLSQQGCYISEKYVSGVEVSVSASADLKFTDWFDISEKSGFSKGFDISEMKILNLFKIGKEKFVDSDSVGDSVKAAVSTHACSDSKEAVTSDIMSQISSLQTNLNSQYASESINFNLKVRDGQFNPSCNSTVAVRVLVTIRDTANSYPVYDYTGKVTSLANLQLKFYVLSGSYIIQPKTSACTYEREAECSGSVVLSLNPATLLTGSYTTPHATGLSACTGKSVPFKENSCSGSQMSSCAIPLDSESCSGTSFKAPSTKGAYTYYSCIDKNGDGDFADSGEAGSSTLNVLVCSDYSVDSCTNAGCTWCPRCSGRKVNQWDASECVDFGTDCGYTCKEGKCEGCVLGSCEVGERCDTSTCECVPAKGPG